MPVTNYIGLLRGINVTGYNKIAMPELRDLCRSIGWSEVRTYIQSGNLVFQTEASTTVLEGELERAIEERLGLSIPVIVRTAEIWAEYAKGNPFPEESRAKPNLVMLALSKAPLKRDAVKMLQERAVNGERVNQVGDATWIHFPSGVGRSKLTTALLDRLVGSTVTLRNWRTVLKLDEMVRNL